METYVRLKFSDFIFLIFRKYALGEIEDIQNTIYQIAKGNGIEPRDFFKVLYQILLSTTKGPKIGPFILDIGRKNVAEKLSAYI